MENLSSQNTMKQKEFVTKFIGAALQELGSMEHGDQVDAFLGLQAELVRARRSVQKDIDGDLEALAFRRENLIKGTEAIKQPLQETN